MDDARWLTIAEVRRLGCVFPTDLQFFGTVWPTTAEVVLAEPGDIDAVLHLRDEAAAWMVDRGLNQWAPGDFPREFVQVRVDSGQVFVMRRRGRALATVTITWSDELVWGEPSVDAGYVHMLAVSSALRGSGLGGWLLDWAEGHIAGHGHKRARLDCVQANPVLRNWYRERGYRQVGQRSFDAPSWSPVVLLEKELARSKQGLGPCSRLRKGPPARPGPRMACTLTRLVVAPESRRECTRSAALCAVNLDKVRCYALLFWVRALRGPRSRSSTVCLRENRRYGRLRYR